MSAGTAQRRAAGLAGGRGFDPLRSVWDLLTNVKFALTLVVLALGAGAVGTVIPQMPVPMRANPAARAAWMELRREDFGPFTDPLDALGLFDVFHSPWFTALWAVIIVAVTVCTVSRFRPTWRNVQKPPKAVPDTYFERARYRAQAVHDGGTDAVEALLRDRRYTVERVRADDGGTYLFADRYPWSQYGTFVSHLALLMLLVGALLTLLAGFDRTLALSEASPAVPVLDEPGPGQIFVRLADAYRGVDSRGNIVAYHSDVEVRRGDQVVTCRVTVNGPCGAFGHRVHQAAFFDDLARLRITADGGRVLFDGVLDFEGRTAVVPALQVTGPSGAVLTRGPVPQLATDPGPTGSRDDDLAVSSLAVADGERRLAFGLAWDVIGGEIRLVVSTSEGLRALAKGDVVRDSGFELLFEGPALLPATRVEDMPGASEGATVQLLRRPGEADQLVVTGVDEDNLVLQPGAPVRSDQGLTYTFGGGLEGSGLSVRRDPGDTFIWLAVGMGLLGLAVTFYVPRRRLWVRVGEGQTSFAGVAERSARFDRELADLASKLRSGPTDRPAVVPDRQG